MKLNELLELLKINDNHIAGNGEFLGVDIDVIKNEWIFNFKFNEVLPIDSFVLLKSKLIERFSRNYLVGVKVKYENNVVKQQLLRDYYAYSYEKALEEFPRVSMLENFNKKMNGSVIFEVKNEDDEQIVREKLNLLTMELIECGVKIEFEIDLTEDASSSAEMISEQLNKIDSAAQGSLDDGGKVRIKSTGTVRGKLTDIQNLPRTLDEVNMEASDLLQIEGYVFDHNIRTFPKGSTLFEAYVTNYEDSIKVKKIIRERDPKVIALYTEILSKGKWIKCSGYTNFDKYSHDVVFDMMEASTVNKEEATDTDDAVEKRVELHVHSKMSSMDGISHIKDYVDKAISWGHKAIAVTDHNTVQSFPDFNYATKGKNILPIYGVELNYVDDSNVVITRNEEHLNLMESTFVVFDIETTGFSVNHDDIIEIAAIKIDNGVFTEFSSFISTNQTLSENTKRITSIQDNDLVGVPTIKEVMTDFKQFIQGSILVAHNADFDMSHLYESFHKLGLFDQEYPTIDTLTLSRVLYDGQLKLFNLKSLSKFLKVDLTQHHRAIYDTRATADVLMKMLEEVYFKGIRFHDELNGLISNELIHKFAIPKHLTVLAKTRLGLKNMYKILSDASTKRFHRGPRALKSTIEKYRTDILIGSSCVNGQVFDAALNKDFETLREVASFYDYLEVQPPLVYSHLAQGNSERFSSYILDAIKRIVLVGEELGIPVCATSDSHHIYKNQADYRKIYLRTPSVGGGLHPLARVKNVPPMYLRTTTEMLEDFDFLANEEKVKEIVIDNTNLIADQIERFDLFPKELFTPKDDFFSSIGVESIKDTVEEMVWGNARSKYGANLPALVEERVTHELKTIIDRGFGNVYYISHLLVKKSLEAKYLVGSRGSVGSSLVATLMDVTEVNPLPPHYVCPSCQFSVFKQMDAEFDPRTAALQEQLQKVDSGFDLPHGNCPRCGHGLIGDGHDIPFATFLGFKGDKVPDIDLNFSGDYQSQAHEEIRKMFGTDYAFRAGTISTIQDKTAYGYVKGYSKDNDIHLRDAEIQRQVNQIQGVRRSTGQHPGGIVVVPHEVEIYDVTPIQYPADDITSSWRTTHFDYHSFESNLFKLDVLGHDDPTMIRKLMDFVEENPKEFPFESVYDIPMVDKDVISLFSSTRALRTNRDIFSTVGTYGVPELGTGFVRQMLEDTKPSSFSEILKISGLSHGTDVWLGNAKDLVQGKTKYGQIPFSDVIGCRDDIMIYLMYQGLDPADAYDITETARRTGRYLSDEQKNIMIDHNIPEWYIWSCDQIKYMFPKAHAAAYVMMALRIAWFKVHRPIYFYATYFSKRAVYFDVDAFLGGYDGIKARIEGIRAQAKPSNKDLGLITVLEIALEMTARGYTFTNIDMEKSEASEFLINEDKKSLLIPFACLDGLGKNVADSIVNARKEKEFSSVEDIKKRTRLSKTLLQKLTDLGVLSLVEKEENQMSLF